MSTFIAIDNGRAIVRVDGVDMQNDSDSDMGVVAALRDLAEHEQDNLNRRAAARALEVVLSGDRERQDALVAAYADLMHAFTEDPSLAEAFARDSLFPSADSRVHHLVQAATLLVEAEDEVLWRAREGEVP